jgi:hypothetical protein
MALRGSLPTPVRPRRAWFIFATTAVCGTIAAAVLTAPLSIICGVLAAVGATGAFAMFVVIVLSEDRAEVGQRPPPQGVRHEAEPPVHCAEPRPHAAPSFGARRRRR